MSNAGRLYDDEDDSMVPEEIWPAVGKVRFENHPLWTHLADAFGATRGGEIGIAIVRETIRNGCLVSDQVRTDLAQRFVEEAREFLTAADFNELCSRATSQFSHETRAKRAEAERDKYFAALAWIAAFNTDPTSRYVSDWLREVVERAREALQTELPDVPSEPSAPRDPHTPEDPQKNRAGRW